MKSVNTNYNCKSSLPFEILYTKVKGILVMFLLLLTPSIFAQKFQWVNSFDGFYRNQEKKIAVNGSGDVFVTGNFADTVDFDPSTGVVNLVAKGNKDAYIAKYDVAGNYLWAISLGDTNGSITISSIALDGAGNPVITGALTGSVAFNPVADSIQLTSNGGSDIFLAKYNASGQYLWSNNIGGFNGEKAHGIAIDGSGGIIITGVYSSPVVDFDPSSGGVTNLNLSNSLGSGDIDIFIAKYDVSGNFNWAKRIGDSGYEHNSKDVVLDGSGNIFITGFFEGEEDFDPSGGAATLFADHHYDAFLAKYTNSGGYLWAINLGGSLNDFNGYQSGASLAVDGSGNVYMTGYASASTDFDPSGNRAYLPESYGAYPLPVSQINFLAKYSGSGQYVYAKSLGAFYSSGLIQSNTASVTVDYAGNAIVTGNFAGAFDFDPLSTIGTLASVGTFDAFLAKYGATGDFYWAFKIGGLNPNFSGDYGASVALDGASNILLGGQFYGTADFDPTSDTVFRTSSIGAADFISKYHSASVKIDQYVAELSFNGRNPSSSAGGKCNCVWVRRKNHGSAIPWIDNVCNTSVRAVYPPADYVWGFAFGACKSSATTASINLSSSAFGTENVLLPPTLTDTFEFTVSCPYITFSPSIQLSDTSGTGGRLIIQNIQNGLAPYDFLLTNTVGDTFSVSNANQALFSNLDTGYYHVLVTDSFGCTAVDSFNLYIDTSACSGKYSFIVNSMSSICLGDSMLLAGMYRKSSGFYFDTLSNGNSCDSVVAYELNVKRSDTVEITYTTSDTNLVGVIDSTYTNNKGCDSLVITSIFYVPADSCVNDSVTVYTLSCDTSLIGTSHTTYVKNDGCDSVVTTINYADTIPPNLQVQPFTAYLDSVGVVNIRVSDLVLSASDNCSVDSLWCKRFGVNDSMVNVANGTFTGGMTHVESVTGAGGATNYRSSLGTSCSDNWYPPGSFCDEGIAMHSPDSSYKSNIWSGATWDNTNPGTSYGVLVADLGASQTLRSMSVFQMFSDGKTTHIRAFYHNDSSGVAPTQNDTGWKEFVPYTKVTPGTHSGNIVTDPLQVDFNPINTRYVKFFAYNDLSYGSPNYIEIRAIKLFSSPLTCDFFCADVGTNKVYVFAKDVAGNITVDSALVDVLDSIGTCGVLCINDSLSVNATTCDSTMAGTVITTHPKQDGCDSVVTTITVYDPGSMMALAAKTICDGDSVMIFGNYEMMAGIYYDSLQNQNGCDSILSCELILLRSDTVYQSSTTTDSTMAGVFDSLYTNVVGCDSLVITTIIYNPLPCTNDSLTVNATTCDSTLAGTTVLSYPKSDGCDSIVTTITIYDPGSIMALPAKIICQGDSILIFGNYQMLAGTYYDSLQNQNGCDSLLSCELMVNPVVTVNVMDSICPGSSLFVGGSYQTTAGIYYDTLMTSKGCDSTVITTITVRTDPGCGVQPSTGDSLVLVTEPGWMKSTVTNIAEARGYPWMGVSSLPPIGTFILPAEIGQPKPWHSIDSVEGAHVFKSGNGVTFFRTTFALTVDTGVMAQIRSYMDDGMEIYINGQVLAREADREVSNSSGAQHHLMLMADGTQSNGHNGDQEFDVVNNYRMDSLVNVGQNELVIALRNAPKASDKGGFSFRMDIKTGVAAPKVLSQYIVSDAEWMKSTVSTPGGSSWNWPGVNSLPAHSTFTEAVEMGQPRNWYSTEEVEGSFAIKAPENVTYYRRRFSLTDSANISARLRSTFDENLMVFINDSLIAGHYQHGLSNRALPAHDVAYPSGGVPVNGNAGGDMFMQIENVDFDQILRKGDNYITVALQNRANEPGGFSLRLDLDQSGTPVIHKTEKVKAPSNDDSDALAFNVYPNPTSGKVYIELLKSPSGDNEVLVFDLNGKLLYQRQLINPETGLKEVNLKEYADGMYIIRIRSGEKMYMGKRVMKF